MVVGVLNFMSISIQSSLRKVTQYSAAHFISENFLLTPFEEIRGIATKI